MARITVATDGSNSANRAVDAAAELAKATDSELVILTVGGHISGGELRRLAGTGGELDKSLKEMTNRILDRARKRIIRHDGALNIRLEAGWGDPAEAIIEMVRRNKSDILVVGRRGRGRLSGLLLGSVSQKLSSLAPCNVMIVP